MTGGFHILLVPFPGEIGASHERKEKNGDEFYLLRKPGNRASLKGMIQLIYLGSSGRKVISKGSVVTVQEPFERRKWEAIKSLRGQSSGTIESSESFVDDSKYGMGIHTVDSTVRPRETKSRTM